MNLRIATSAKITFVLANIAFAQCAQAQIAYIGAGTVAGNATDFSGQSQNLGGSTPANRLGGFGSGIAYTGLGNTYVSVPDSGPNVGSSATDNTVAYQSRAQVFSIAVDPLAHTVTPVLQSTKLFADESGVAFTGLSSSFVSGQPSTYAGNHRLDPEAVRVSNDRSTYYVADEYGPTIYGFIATTGKRTNSFVLPANVSLANPAATEANELANNTSGRQSGRSMEGLAITPDGNTLVGIFQNPLLQDHALNSSGNRNGVNDRIVTVDVTTGQTHEYLYQLHDNSYGVNEIVAVNSHQFLVSERDGSGGTSAAFKQLFLIDTAAASDISGVPSLPTSGVPGGVTPVSSSLFLDLLDPTYGLAGSNFPSKIEGLSFGPDLIDGRHLLLVTSDNDFSATTPTYIFAFAIPANSLSGFQAQQFVPEPSTAILAGVGIAVFLARLCSPKTAPCTKT